jgi:DNA invertase Pin-like site-specific DNA recombinase
MKIGYARVSTEDQNLDLQVSALQKAGCDTICRDSGVSGAAVSRPGLNKALCKLKKNDILVVWRLDRLGRSLVHLVHTINDLEKRGIHFRSLTENIDTSSSGGRLVFHIMAAMAEFERNLISERTRAGMTVAKASGRNVGRPPVLSEKERSAAVRAIKKGEAKIVVARRYGVSIRTIERVAVMENSAKTNIRVSEC